MLLMIIIIEILFWLVTIPVCIIAGIIGIVIILLFFPIPVEIKLFNSEFLDALFEGYFGGYFEFRNMLLEIRAMRKRERKEKKEKRKVIK